VRSAENIEKLIKNLDFDINTNPKTDRVILSELLQAHERSRKTESVFTLPNLRRTIMKSPITKVVAGAVLLFGLFMLTRYLTGREAPATVEPIRTATTVQERTLTEPNNPQALLAKELEMARQLLERQDLPGLLELLQTGQASTKMQVAEYLGQIGNGSALSSLQILAEQWQGPEQDNPFRKAIAAIRERQTEPEGRPITSSREPNEPQVPPAAIQTIVAGTVIDKDTAQPIPGARVGFKPTESVATDAQGRFQLVYEKTYEEANVYATASGYAARRIVTRVKTGSTQNITIELSPGSKLAGKVTNPNGQAIKGAEVGIFGLTYSDMPTVTNAEGQFEIEGLNPVVHSYQIHVTHTSYPAAHVSVQPAATGQTRDVEIILKPGVVVFGQVSDSKGSPISGVTVGNTRSRAMWNCITDQTDDAGMYQLDNVEVGELVLWAVHNQHAPFVEHTVLAGGQAERCIDIQLKAPRALHGRVTDGDGNPVTKATVVISDYNGVSNLGRGRHSCDSEGRFTIPNAPTEGDMELRIFGEGITGTNHKVDFSRDECLITVRRSGKIYGKVLDATTAEPIGKFMVKMTATKVGRPTYGYAARWSDEGYTFDSSEGWFDTGREDLPVKGQYRMTVSAAGYDPVTLDPVEVQAISDDPNRTEFGLTSTTVFAGRVVTGEGLPIQAVAVVFFSDGSGMERESWPRAATDKTGVFTISGLSSEPQVLFVSAAGFAPRVYLMKELIEAPGQLTDIVLDRSGRVFGRVFDENSKGMAGASVHAFVDLGRAREVLKRFPSLGPRVNTDKDGYYDLSGVPTGQVQIGVQSPRNYTVGHKKVELKPGKSMELNFGEEGGYVITGTVRAGDDTLEGAYVTLYSREADLKNDGTNQAGRFKVINLPEGTYTLSIDWTPSHAHGTTKWPKDTRFRLHRPLEVHKNMELDIDLVDGSVSGIGGGSVSGVIPQSFWSGDGLTLTTMREVTSPADTTESQKWRRAAVPLTKVETEGRFTVSQLPDGRYYLLLWDSEKTLAVSEVFDIAEAQNLEGLQFNHGNGRLLIRVVDARTNVRIPGARFTMSNDMEAGFFDKGLTQKKTGRIMTTNEEGQCLYDGLPNGRYKVKSEGYGYSLGQSDWADVTAGQQTELTVRLEPAAMVRFDLKDTIREQITADSVMISCKVTDATSHELVRDISIWGENDSHYARIFLSASKEELSSVLSLPEGTFNIEYTIRTRDVVDGAQVGMGKTVAQGKATVTCQAGQTATIVVAGQ